jgi:hypothetical protein
MGWQADPKTPLPKRLVFSDPDKIRELAYFGPVRQTEVRSVTAQGDREK